MCGRAVFGAADRPAGGGPAGGAGAGGLRRRGAADGKRVAGGRDGRHRVGGHADFASAASDSGPGRHGAGVVGRRAAAVGGRRVRAVGACHSRAGRSRAGLVAAVGGPGLAQAVGRCGRRRLGRAAGDRAFGRGHLRPVQRGRRRRKSAGGGRDRTDHGAGHRGGGTVPDLAGRRAAADPFHRPRVVVGGRGGPPGRGRARRHGARPGRDGGHVDRRRRHAAGGGGVAVVAWRWRRFRAAAAAALLVGLAWVLSGLA
ncbi:hypothetical protein MAP44135_1653 [Mycobacterium avium subsp. paratuberculosis]|nr:hypothetical protein MAP44135_1653 [Mycobacterium avium subsp. paratuberculosis]